MKTVADLDAFLAKTVPVLVHRFMINSGAVKVCGAISDAFGTLAKDNGFEAYVAGRPGHFVNEIVTQEGVYEVDLSAIQFECQDEEDVPRALERLTENPYRAMKIRKVCDLSYAAREPAPENPDFFYTPLKSYPFWEKMAHRAGRGEYDPRFEWEIAATGGKPFGYGVPWAILTSVGLVGAAVFFAYRSPKTNDTLSAGTTMKTLEDLGASILARTGDAQEIIGAGTMPPPAPPESEGAQTVNAIARNLWGVASTVSFGASFYHGLKRNNSLGWGLGWGVLGMMFPIVTPLYAVHQGFAKPATP